MPLYSIGQPSAPLYSIGINWIPFCQGPSLEELKLTTADRQLSPGSKVRFALHVRRDPIFRYPQGWLFDLAGVEHLFDIPGVAIDDVRSTGWDDAVVEGHIVEVKPSGVAGYALLPALAAIVAFIGAHWVAIVIGGVALVGLVLAIRGEFLPLVEAGVEWTKWVVIGGLGVGGLLLAREVIRKK